MIPNGVMLIDRDNNEVSFANSEMMNQAQAKTLSNVQETLQNRFILYQECELQTVSSAGSLSLLKMQSANSQMRSSSPASAPKQDLGSGEDESKDVTMWDYLIKQFDRQKKIEGVFKSKVPKKYL